jgi:uncharacterized protein (DUF58 family)
MRFFVLRRSYLIGFLLAASLITGMATGLGLFYRLVYILALVIVLGYAWNWLSLRSLTVVVDRRTRRITVGDPVREHITVNNTSALPRPVIEVEDLSELPGFTTGNAMSMLPGGSITWTSSGTARRRGVYTMGPVVARNTDPFGLFRRELTFPYTDTVVVYPRAYDLPGFRVPSANLSGDSSLKRRTHDLTPHASSVREYAPGDALSRVHWNSTARVGKLMSKEFDEGHASDVWIAVDLHRDVQAGQLEDSTDEYAVSVAASLAKRFLTEGMPVGMIVYGTEKVLLGADTGPGQMDRILESLARSESEGLVPIGDALSEDEALWSHHTTLVVVTSSPRPEWVGALEQLARRRVKVASVLVDGRSFGGFYDSLQSLSNLESAGIPTYVVSSGDDISTALSQMHRGAGVVQPIGRVADAVGAKASTRQGGHGQ